MPSGQIDLGDGRPRSAKNKFSNMLEAGKKVVVVGHEFGDLIVRAHEDSEEVTNNAQNGEI
ncbi:MAG: hypothetical protein HRU15_17325 [Planctomycetes bacterium]|nr:hypothetical protein [Planctomycetota bacterium]